MAWGLRVGTILTALVPALGSGCGDDPPTPVSASPAPPSDPAHPGKVEPAPHSPLALGRAVFGALQQDDWEGYTNVLATRADMLAIFEDTDRGDRRERRKRRRMVWRRVNRLRNEEAEEGWSEVLRSARLVELPWTSARLVDVRQAPAKARRLPPDAKTAHLRLVVEHRDSQRGIDLGTCVRTPRGWVVLHPMRWLGEGHGEPFGESLMDADATP